MSRPLHIYVDVDDTLVSKNDAGDEQPIGHVASHIRELCRQGAILYCWSTGGADHAHSMALKLQIEECFTQFLHKPQVFIDDERTEQWPEFVHISPDKLGTLEEYFEAVIAKKAEAKD